MTGTNVRNQSQAEGDNPVPEPWFNPVSKNTTRAKAGRAEVCRNKKEIQGPVQNYHHSRRCALDAVNFEGKLCVLILF